MDAQFRRKAVAQCLEQADQPISATALASRFSVSRQIIVGDIALLRAGGLEIAATPRGYVLPKSHDGIVKKVACVHGAEDTGRELEIMVDNGCIVLDVLVEHAVYGHLNGQLHLSSRYDVQQFLEKVSSSDSLPLSSLTRGVHLHTLCCPDEAAYQRVIEQLRQEQFLYES